jgi:hypothetical protein
MTDLPRYTWDQAEILRLWPPASFAAVGINPTTVRKWASRGHIKAAGQGPNGCRLYPYGAVVAYADRHNMRGSTTPDLCPRCGATITGAHTEVLESSTNPMDPNYHPQFIVSRPGRTFYEPCGHVAAPEPATR